MVIVFGAGMGLLGLFLNRFANIRDYNLSLVINGIMISNNYDWYFVFFICVTITNWFVS